MEEPSTAPELAELDSLEARARLARASVEDRPLEEAARLTGLEHDLLSLTGELARQDPHLADDRGHPVLADVGRWRGRCRALGLEAAEGRASALLGELVGDEADRWRRAVAAASTAPEPGACFELLTEAAVLDGEVLARQGDRPDAPPLAGERGPLRETFLEAIEATPPPEEVRGRWATDLLDRADVVLVGLDDLSPAAAAAQLDVVAGDLAWHVGDVENEKSPRRGSLKRKLRRITAEKQERDLQGRLEVMFGPKRVGYFERLILWLIFLVLGLLALETFVDLPENVRQAFIVIDTLACFVFLWDFFVRLALVQGSKGRWFARHALVDLLPSIPVGLLQWRPIRAGRALRFLRVARMAKYLRGLMPAIRTLRAIGFLTRGVDRVVRRYGHLLNRDVILYPTREEKARALSAEQSTVARLRRLQSEINDLWEDLLRSTPSEEQAEAAKVRLGGLEVARNEGLTQRPPGRAVRVDSAREIPAEVLLRRLETATPEGVEADLGPDFVSRAARAVRMFSKPPLKWIPFFGTWFPRLGPAMTDSEVTAAAAHHAAKRLHRHYDRWFFFADLYGTVTPAEFVDGVGSTLVRSTLRPAYKLALFGGAFLLVQLILILLPGGFFEWLGRVLDKLVGTPLIVLGTICALILGVGWWLRRIARQATSFYEQVALAQFLSLTESIKGRFLDRDAALLTRRVVAPESLLRGDDPEADTAARRARFAEGVRAWLLEAHSVGDARGAFDAMERTVLLYRDGLDGGLLHTSDTRTTNQLLGNPALRHFEESAGCVDRREQKELAGLDLEHQRRMFSGPYFWFSLVTGAVAQSVAHLIVEYNRHAVPLAELAYTTAEERARYDVWLADGDGADPEVEAGDHERPEKAPYVTAAFSALHFLDDDERRDAEVATRFGDAVLVRLVRDRRRLIRRIFGTYPLHTRPHEVRVVNLYRIYEKWLAGGRALLLPLRGLGAAILWIGRVIGWVAAAVHQIRNPLSADEYQQEAESDFSTAVRKIDRMRGPVVRASLWLRARADPEYLGVRLPATRRTGLEGLTVQRDLDFLDAPAKLRFAVEEEHDRAQADMRRLARLIDDGLFERVAHTIGLHAGDLDREHMRAAAFAYRADIYGVRSLLSATDVLRETSAEAMRRTCLPGKLCFRFKLRRALKRWWKENGRGGRRGRKAAWRAAVHDLNGAGRALAVIAAYDDPDAAFAEGEKRLTDLLRHPGRLSGQLVTLRAVQNLALIDVLNYRTHIWRLGEYAADGDDPGSLLTLNDHA